MEGPQDSNKTHNQDQSAIGADLIEIEESI
jgi:hypothetical protein